MNQCQNFGPKSDPINQVKVVVDVLGELLRRSCWFQVVSIDLVNFMETWKSLS